MRFGHRPVCLLAHPEHVKRVLQDNHRAYGKAHAADRVRPLFGDSLTTIDGDRWHAQRRRMQPMFHAKAQLRFVPAIVEATAEMLDRWRRIAEDGRTVDPLDEMKTLTRAIIVRVLFGPVEPADAAALGEALDVAVDHVERRLWSPVMCLAAPTAARRRFRRALASIDAFVDRTIARAREDVLASPALLASLAGARDTVTAAPMTDAELRHEVKALLVAGHTTLASALAWACYVVASDADVAHRLQHEVHDVVVGRLPAADDLPRLEYTRMLIAEVLRLYPPTWMTARTALEDDEVGGYRIPAGAIVVLSPFVTQRHPQFWPDPERLDPERFAPSRAEGRPAFAYFPFGRGPRSCIGSTLGVIEMQLVVAMMAQRFRLACVPGRPVGLEPGLTLRPQPRVPMALTALDGPGHGKARVAGGALG